MSTYKKTPKVKKDAGIYELDRGGFYVKTKGQTKTFETLAEARAWKEDVRVALRNGTHQADTGHTLLTYFEEIWLPSLLVRKPTRERYDRSMRKHVIPVLGDRKLEDIIGPDLDDLALALLAKGMKPDTVTTTINPLKTLLTYAHKRRVLRVNEGKLTDPDILKVERKKVTAKPVRAMDEIQLAAFFKHIPSEFRLLFDVLLGTGMRVSEVLGLTFEQVSADSILIDRRWASQEENAPKNGMTRSVPISKGLSNKLTLLRTSDGEIKTGLVFPNPRGSHWSDITLSRRALDPARKGAKLPFVTFHVFRHTYAARMYRLGVPLGDLSDWLGHHDPAFTWKTYVHLFENQRPSVDFLDDIDPGGTPVYTETPEPQSQSQVSDSLLERG